MVVHASSNSEHVFVKIHRSNAIHASSNDVGVMGYHVVPVRVTSVGVERESKHQVGVLVINDSSA
jgi:hypothetical protein